MTVKSVWSMYENDGDEEPTLEAVKYENPDGLGYTVESWHTAVGQVSYRGFTTEKKADDWLHREGFEYLGEFEDGED